MAKKRAARSDHEESEEEEDQVMNCDDEMDNDDDNDDDNDSGNDEEMEEEEEQEEEMMASPSPIRKKDMTLRSGRRKRRRSKETTGLTPPDTIKKATKRARKSTTLTTTAIEIATTTTTTIKSAPVDIAAANGDQKRLSVAFAAAASPAAAVAAAKASTELENAAANGNGESIHAAAAAAAVNGDDNIDGAASSSSPAIVPNPRRISYSQPPSGIPSNIPEQENESTSDNDNDNKEKLEEIDIVPPKLAAHTNGTSPVEQSVPQDEAAVTEQLAPQYTETEEKEVTGNNENGDASETLEEETSNNTSSTSTSTSTSISNGVSNLQRIAMLVILGFVSLRVSMPQVIKLTQIMVPLDDSMLPPPPKISTTQFIQVDQSEQPEEEEEEEEKEEEKPEPEPEIIIEYIDPPPLEESETWNKAFSQEFEKLLESKEEYSSSTQNLTDYYDEVMGRFEKIQAQLQTGQKKVVKRSDGLDLLKELLMKEVHIENEEGDLKDDDDNSNKENDNWDQARALAQQLLGKTLLNTSSIALWDIPENLDADCDLEEEEDDDDDGDGKLVEDDDEEKEIKPLLTTQLLEEKESALMLRSTMTAEKFIGGAVAENRVRKWAKSQITKAINGDKDAGDALEDIKAFAQKLSKIAEENTQKDKNGDSSDALDLLLTQMIQSRFEVHRADMTGILDHASIKNGAEIIYGGKRGTSKSLIDYLPIFNRILQTSNLRFYGFGPEAALTATYPPNALGQCWSFQQTPLKEQLKDRQLFENDESVPNDFKRGNFGTLTIRLPAPISVDSVIIEHPPIQLTDQADSVIRSFRVVGYEDEMASSKAWNLGSFEYSMRDNRNNNENLQQFEVATTVFGKEIPPLHSISLAVDSNFGHEYACLYRFRVHSKEE